MDEGGVEPGGPTVGESIKYIGETPGRNEVNEENDKEK